MDRTEQAKFKRYAIPQANGCWLWTGDGTHDGYGTFQSKAGSKRVMIHRWVYENYIGPIPEGMQIDHRCHTDAPDCQGGPDCQHRRCCNPAHLEPVTGSENTLRQRHAGRARTQCPKGHPYEGDNLIQGKDGKRRCRTCDKARKRKA